MEREKKKEKEGGKVIEKCEWKKKRERKSKKREKDKRYIGRKKN